ALALPEFDDGRTGLGALHLVTDRDAEGRGQLAITDRRREDLLREPEGHAQHHEPAGAIALEDTGPVAEAALLVRDVEDFRGLPVVDPHPRDRLRDFLAVSADVLDRGGTRQAGDAGQALEAGQAPGDGPGDHLVPVLAGRHDHRAGPGTAADAAGRHLDHGAV